MLEVAGLKAVVLAGDVGEAVITPGLIDEGNGRVRGYAGRPP